MRDTYTNDEGAARVLDKALARVEAQGQDVEAVELARVLAARAEIAVALGDETRAEALQVQMAALALPPEAWEMYGHELRAAEETSRWIGGD